MTAEIIILCQGAQSRLPMLPVAKQLIPLPHCGDTPILYRTIRQLWDLAVKDGVSRVSVVASFSIMERLLQRPVPIGTNGAAYAPFVTTLADPGNSSLKGIRRYLSYARPHREHAEFQRTIVLLGDVIYSWACLRAILNIPLGGEGFVGSSNLSRGGGELWGLGWTRAAEIEMLIRLEHALNEHPPFIDYQPGQMRRWLWAVTEARRTRAERYQLNVPWFTAIDDYTHDIDLPEHLAFVPALSQAAAIDDAAEGIRW